MSELRTPEVEDLLTVFSKIQDKDDIFLLLEDLFTIREIRETSQRLAVARQLDAGNSYASIEKATGASATTIARVSKCLSYGAGGYTMALNILDDARKGKSRAAGRGRGFPACPVRQPRIRRLPWCSLRRALCQIPCSALVIKSPYSAPVEKSVDTAVPKPAVLLRGRRAFRFSESCPSSQHEIPRTCDP